MLSRDWFVLVSMIVQAYAGVNFLLVQVMKDGCIVNFKLVITGGAGRQILQLNVRPIIPPDCEYVQ
jgi:hypothetical protein